MVRDVWRVDMTPTQRTRSVEVSIKGIAAMRAHEGRRHAGTELAAGGALLGRECGVDRIDGLSCEGGLVLDELPELAEAPPMQPTVLAFASLIFSLSFPYPFEVFKDDDVGVLDYALADAMIDVAHVAFLPATKHPEVPLGGLCVFALQSSSKKMILLDPGARGREEPAVARDGQVLYSEVDTDHLVATRRSDVGLFGKGDVSPSALVFESSVLPIEILAVV